MKSGLLHLDHSVAHGAAVEDGIGTATDRRVGGHGRLGHTRDGHRVGVGKSMVVD